MMMMIPAKKGKGARSRLKKKKQRDISNYLFHYQTLSAAMMMIPPSKGKRARSILNLRYLPSELIEEIPAKKKGKRAISILLNNRHIPSELIEGILLNLPHKSLVRFSAVSKSWKSMIFDPVFARKHKNRLRRHRLLVLKNPFMHDIDADALFSLAPISSDFCMKVTKKRRRSSDGSKASVSVFSNAKVDVRDLSSQFEGKPRLLAYCDELWCVQVKKRNPSMRNIVKVLPPPSSLKSADDYIYGLGYDSVNDDYKILKIERYPPCRSELYSLKDDCWREIESSFSSDDGPSNKQRRCEFVGGRFHWFGFSEIIVSFDLSTEKYGEVAPPHEYDDDKAYSEELKVVTLNGKLCAYVNYEDHDDDETQFILWVMEEYGVEKSWTLKFDIMLRHPSIFGVSCSSPETLTPLYLSDNNDDLLVKIEGGCCVEDMYILMYRNGEASPLKIIQYEDYDVDPFLYVESLITHDNFSHNR